MRQKVLGVSVAASLIIGGLSTVPVKASFGDAVAGGLIGGVVGSVITNEVYKSRRSHRSSGRSSSRRRHRAVAPRPVMTDEKRIQKALSSLGFYHGPIDGQINSFETRTAIKELNRAYEIGDTAYLSPQERDALVYLGTLLDFDRVLISQGTDRRSKTRRVQTALKIMGYYHGTVDGATGPNTRRAIADYNMASGYGSGTSLGYENEYRLISTAKQTNDRNIEDTLSSLKRMGAASKSRQPAGNYNNNTQQPVILQPSQSYNAPQQQQSRQPATPPAEATIVQEAPAQNSTSYSSQPHTQQATQVPASNVEQPSSDAGQGNSTSQQQSGAAQGDSSMQEQLPAMQLQ